MENSDKLLQGLTSKEVEALVRDGKTNSISKHSSQSVASIILSNVVTYFNAIFFGLAFLVIMVGAYRNLLFLPVVLANIIIGIIQQLRAKKVLDKLSLLDITEYTVIRDGRETSVGSEKLVLGDIVILRSGQQIPADAELIEGKISANESLLTGEADEIEKEEGSVLMSGSFVVSGECKARLTHVGVDSYAARLTEKAKEVKNKKSEMIKDIETIIKVAGILIIPVGILMIIDSVVINGRNLQDGVVAVVSAIVGMIPEGLYLLLTVALTMSAARLALKKVLLHDMRSIETLARVDVLCVDKTGTITSDVMSVTDVFAPKGKDLGKEAKDIFTKYIHTVPDTNITMVALRNYFKENITLDTTEVKPFSSKEKFSEIITKEATYRLGAPEFILTEEILNENKTNIEKYTGKGERVLAFIKIDQIGTTPILFVSIANEIRENAPDTFKYFAEQGVIIKVISGDNPLTVSRVAMAANIENADKFVDASTLETEEDYLEAVREYTVFGRVKPEQKKSLIKAIKKNGQKVAMTGDGVNDILAMKSADCSIAMGGGSDAARQAAQVVLLDSDFSHMKQIVSEGRRIINNMTRSGILFLYKNIFSLLLALFTIVLSIHYPLKPTQISLISMFNIGLPGFLLAMENNTRRQRGRLLTRTLRGAIPSSVISFLAIAVFMYIGPKFFNLTDDEMGVAGTYFLSAVGFVLLWKLIHPLNKYRIFVFVLCVTGMVGSIIGFWNIFIMAEVTVRGTWISVGYALAGALLMRLILKIMAKMQLEKVVV
ncbi:cation-transporting ATPase E [Eubacterium ruminantium]|uniref:Cation-transporting ATPase E n=1 Tax=Eubacterium ruminantium TaxID=42322 RepID=A0A1T4N2B0_9FIRM|nr:HAD-IC family P-type ATPase [Eubacterium ruminantium]SCW51524.1 cation-transporting ATPase E [Eubacterium ruminantium]SDM67328.1 cation-transporting ATPase E [Eubacterium ruminantium]SJZ73246.1 cation-transporting ATPase E [Eubacterium ruminantium]